MKVLAINGSPRKKGNTSILLNTVLDVLKEEGVETEIFQVGGKKIRGCIACGKCGKMKNKKCANKNDLVNECVEKMLEADGILLGSPTYFADVSTEMKALIDRTGYVARCNGHLFRRKVGAAVASARRAGSMNVLDTMNHFFAISGMIVPGSTYWNLGIGNQEGAVLEDEEGISVMKELGSNMAWLLKKIHHE